MSAASAGASADSPFARRRAGVLLHPTSLPGPALGADAYRFIDTLASMHVSIWQMLPLGPTHADRSPYACLSVFAGEPALLDWEAVRATSWWQDGLEPAQMGVHFIEQATETERAAYRAFLKQQQYWLPDYALYQALREEQQHRSWLAWPEELRDRAPKALKQARQRLGAAIERVQLEQFLFDQQWRRLKAYANERDVLLFGDMPIFVALDSAEVWARREFFTLDEQGRPLTVAGVPPDYFSATGQRWGNPLYRWDRMQEERFAWWRKRVGHQLDLFDLVRIDHFRGFQAFWEIPAEAETAVDGHWVEAPGDALFKSLRRSFNPLPLVAEDLGLITPEVEGLRKRHGLPGMKVLQFAFDGGSDNPYLPHQHERDYLIYTGTHDNNTTRGWYDELDDAQRAEVRDYLACADHEMPWALVRAALASVGQIAILPWQDVLGLDGSHRMNVPGVSEGNWDWTFNWDFLQADAVERLRHWVEIYGRTI